MKAKTAEKQQYLTIDLSNSALTCSWITTTKYDSLLHLNALHSYHLPFDACLDGALYNMGNISAKIRHFIANYNLHNAATVIALPPESLYQAIATSPIASPTAAYFARDELQQLIWQAHYLHPIPDNSFAFYITGLRRELLAQYQLLAIHANLNLVALTPIFSAEMHAYKKIHGHDFKHMQAHNSLETYHAALRTTFTNTTIATLARCETTIPHATAQQTRHIITACGLALSGELTNEKH